MRGMFYATYQYFIRYNEGLILIAPVNFNPITSSPMILPKRFYHHWRDAIAIGYMRYSYNNETMIKGKKKDILIRENIP